MVQKVAQTATNCQICHLVEWRLDVETCCSRSTSFLVFVPAFFLLLFRSRDFFGTGIIIAHFFRETEGHYFLEENVTDADGQGNQVYLKVVLHGDPANWSFLTRHKNETNLILANPIIVFV